MSFSSLARRSADTKPLSSLGSSSSSSYSSGVNQVTPTISKPVTVSGVIANNSKATTPTVDRNESSDDDDDEDDDSSSDLDVDVRSLPAASSPVKATPPPVITSATVAATTTTTTVPTPSKPVVNDSDDSDESSDSDASDSSSSDEDSSSSSSSSDAKVAVKPVLPTPTPAAAPAKVSVAVPPPVAATPVPKRPTVFVEYEEQDDGDLPSASPSPQPKPMPMPMPKQPAAAAPRPLDPPVRQVDSPARPKPISTVTSTTPPSVPQACADKSRDIVTLSDGTVVSRCAQGEMVETTRPIPTEVSLTAKTLAESADMTRTIMREATEQLRKEMQDVHRDAMANVFEQMERMFQSAFTAQLDKLTAAMASHSANRLAIEAAPVPSVDAPAAAAAAPQSPLVPAPAPPSSGRGASTRPGSKFPSRLVDESKGIIHGLVVLKNSELFMPVEDIYDLPTSPYYTVSQHAIDRDFFVGNKVFDGSKLMMDRSNLIDYSLGDTTRNTFIDVFQLDLPRGTSDVRSSIKSSSAGWVCPPTSVMTAEDYKTRTKETTVLNSAAAGYMANGVGLVGIMDGMRISMQTAIAYVNSDGVTKVVPSNKSTDHFAFRADRWVGTNGLRISGVPTAIKADPKLDTVAARLAGLVIIDHDETDAYYIVPVLPAAALSEEAKTATPPLSAYAASREAAVASSRAIASTASATTSAQKKSKAQDLASSIADAAGSAVLAVQPVVDTADAGEKQKKKHTKKKKARTHEEATIDQSVDEESAAKKKVAKDTQESLAAAPAGVVVVVDNTKNKDSIDKNKKKKSSLLGDDLSLPDSDDEMETSAAPAVPAAPAVTPVPSDVAAEPRKKGSKGQMDESGTEKKKKKTGDKKRAKKEKPDYAVTPSVSPLAGTVVGFTRQDQIVTQMWIDRRNPWFLYFLNKIQNDAEMMCMRSWIAETLKKKNSSITPQTLETTVADEVDKLTKSSVQFWDDAAAKGTAFVPEIANVNVMAPWRVWAVLWSMLSSCEGLPPQEAAVTAVHIPNVNSFTESLVPFVDSFSGAYCKPDQSCGARNLPHKTDLEPLCERVKNFKIGSGPEDIEYKNYIRLFAMPKNLSSATTMQDCPLDTYFSSTVPLIRCFCRIIVFLMRAGF